MTTPARKSVPGARLLTPAEKSLLARLEELRIVPPANLLQALYSDDKEEHAKAVQDLRRSLDTATALRARLEALRVVLPVDPASAVPELNNIVTRAEKEFGDTSVVSLEGRYMLIYHEARRVNAAVTAKKMSELLATCENALGHEAYLTRRCSMVRAQFTRKAGDPNGIQLYEDELALRKNSDGPDAWRTRLARMNLAVALRESGEYNNLNRADQIAEKELAERSVEYGPEHPRTIVAMANKALILLSLVEAGSKTADAEKALELASEVVRVRQTVLGPLHDSTLSGQMIRAQALIALKRCDEAVWLLYGVLADQAAAGAKDPGRAEELLARALAGTELRSDLEEARQFASEATQLRTRQYGPDTAQVRRAQELEASIITQLAAAQDRDVVRVLDHTSGPRSEAI
ncbi:hypothetical protein EV651_12310 [Kribbella sp. VKM Ac-2571]|uniref:hypothetical protein n=1 Tax=Kribbella sp. VKM Ac-2571 TaxID=2512222 RepID=UPI00105DB9AC|nr:hypothetical protein [Kribbella sp. VKM Ac-2571]TDO48244.1 hypothetical protein EV651_12310 [Kribbella sp. VKM Ac-2571]